MATERWVEIFARPVMTDDGTILGGMIVLRDISESKMAEEQTKRARDLALEAGARALRIPQQHEPRNPHSAQRNHRHDPVAARHRAQPGAARIRRDRAIEHRPAVRDGQRSAGFLQARGRQGRAAADRFRPRAGGRNRGGSVWRARSTKRRGVDSGRGRRRAAPVAWRSRAAPAGVGEPDQQRGQVHRAWRGGGAPDQGGRDRSHRVGALRGMRHRNRDCARGAEASVPALLAG